MNRTDKIVIILILSSLFGIACWSCIWHASQEERFRKNEGWFHNYRTEYRRTFEALIAAGQPVAEADRLAALAADHLYPEYGAKWFGMITRRITPEDGK